MKILMSKQRRILLICLAISAILIAVGIISSNTGVLGNMIILSVFIVAMPQFFMTYEKYRILHETEDRFPAFLKNIIESVRSGMPFHQAILANSRINYGRFSSEVEKMANQISWGVPVDKVIEQFGERVKGSKRLYMAVKIIKETYTSGGDVVSTLETVADNNLVLEEAEKEKKSMLSQYVVLMYAINFLFIGILIAINKLMVPIFKTASLPGASEALGLINPCTEAYGPSALVCDLFSFVSKMFGIDSASIGSYYTSLFFFMSTVEALSCGLIAGQISENSLVAGLKHSMIMLTVTVGVFYISVWLRLLGV